MIVILGAGLSGLSTAYHLKDRDYQIYEKEGEVGGLCRSVSQDGFIFDYTGHLLFLHDDYTRALVSSLLPNVFKTHRRRALIYSKNVFTEYPFQVNLHGLPSEIIKECLLGFIESCANNDKSLSEKGTFEDWLLNAFGKGISKHFMVPYNEKLWRTPVKKMTSDWVPERVPKPNLEEIIAGALGIKNREFGYNTTFLYPKKGGINVLPEAFLLHIKNVNLNKEAVKIFLREKKVTFNDNASVKYHKLISTIPLPDLIEKIEDAPVAIKELSRGLKYVSVLNLNLGIKRGDVSNAHWIYFPEPEFLFYRVGFYNNFSRNIAPHGTSSAYVEVSYKPTEAISKTQIMNKVIIGLKKGLKINSNEIAVRNILNIKYGYVIFDQFRKKNLPKIMKYLEDNGIYSIGRYGGWKYIWMNNCIMEGKNIVERLVRRKG